MAEAFDPASVTAGERAILELDVAPLAVGATLQLPLLVARGARSGKTIVVLGGVHGDEYEGPAAVRNAFRSLDPAAMNGTFIGVPVCNPPAFSARTRTSPLDGQNLARVFPGRPDGTVSERIAHLLTTQVLTHADFLIDLHSGSTHSAMPLLVGYIHGDDEQARVSREAAERFGVPLIWGHAEVTEGRTLTPAHRAGVPWLYSESPSGGRLDTRYAAIYADGVRNVMRYLSIIPGEAPVVSPLREIYGEGDTDKSLRVPVGGFLYPHVELLETVETGQLLGVVEDLAGRTLAEIRAPGAGVVVVRRFAASVNAGDEAFLLT